MHWEKIIIHVCVVEATVHVFVKAVYACQPFIYTGCRAIEVVRVTYLWSHQMQEQLINVYPLFTTGIAEGKHTLDTINSNWSTSYQID